MNSQFQRPAHVAHRSSVGVFFLVLISILVAVRLAPGQTTPFNLVRTEPTGSCTVLDRVVQVRGTGVIKVCAGGTWTAVTSESSGTGDVVGPASSTSGNAATFSGTTGKIVQDSGKALPSGAVVGTTDSQVLTFKTLTLPVITSYTVATLPAAGTANREATVTDAASSASCLVGGGSVVLKCRDTGATWQPLGDGNSGGSSATSLSAITDFASTRTSGTVMTVNAEATVGAPVIARIGSTAYSFTAAGTDTLSGTACSGTVYRYISSAGAITDGHNALTCTFTGSGVTIATPITGFPVDSIPLATLTITSGAWDTTITDRRSFLSYGKRYTAGANIALTETATELIIAATGTLGSAYDQIIDESSSLTKRANLRFTGAGVTCIDDAGNSSTNCEIPGGTGVDPTTRTSLFFRQAYSGFSNSDGWNYNGSCTDPGVGKAATAVDFGTSAFSGAGCRTSWAPNRSNMPAAYGVTYTLEMRGGRNAPAGDIYIGWFDSTAANGVGIRWNNGSSTYQCVVRNGGADSGSPVAISGANDTNDHWFTISNNGTAGRVSCQIDGGSASTVTGATFPSTSPMISAYLVAAQATWIREFVFSGTGRSM